MRRPCTTRTADHLPRLLQQQPAGSGQFLGTRGFGYVVRESECHLQADRLAAVHATRPDLTARPAVDQAPSRPESDSQEFRHIPESPAPRCSRLNSCERDLMPQTSTTFRTVLRSALALICATAAAGCGGGSPSS